MNDTDEDLESFKQYVIGDYIWIYVSPILLIVGTFGNILSIVVLLRPRLRKSTTMFYLTCLNFGDLFTLYTGLLRYWIRKAFDTDLRHLSDASCKIHTFLVYVSLDVTVWILVSVTVDRCLSVSMPFKSKVLCTMKRSKYVISVIVLIAVIKNMHFLWNLSLVHTWEFRCDGKDKEVNHFLRYIWHWIDFSTFCLIPFTVMIICNIKIIFEMFRSQKKLDAHNVISASPNLSMKYKQLTPRQECSEMDLQSTSGREITCTEIDKTAPRNPSRQISQVKKQSPARKLSSLTAMLLTVNCVFLVTTSPIQSFLIGEEYWFPEKTPEEQAWHNFWWAIVNMLQYINNTIHFFLYCLTGPRFRAELICMIRRNHKVSARQSNTEI